MLKVDFWDAKGVKCTFQTNDGTFCGKNHVEKDTLVLCDTLIFGRRKRKAFDIS